MEWLAAYSRLGSVGLCEASASLCVYHSDRFCHIVCWSRFTFVSSVDAAADYFVVFFFLFVSYSELWNFGYGDRSLDSQRDKYKRIMMIWKQTRPGTAAWHGDAKPIVYSVCISSVVGVRALHFVWCNAHGAVAAATETERACVMIYQQC